MNRLMGSEHFYKGTLYYNIVHKVQYWSNIKNVVHKILIVDLRALMLTFLCSLTDRPYH